MPDRPMTHEISGSAATRPREPRLDGALAFLDLVYELAESPSRLSDALARLAELAGVPSILLMSIDGEERRLIAAAHPPRPPSNGNGPIQLRSDRVRTIPLARTLELVIDPGTLCPDDELLLLRLAPHLARALRIADRLAVDDQEEAQSAARLDRLPLGVALLDPAGQVVAINRTARAILAVAKTIAVVRHRIELTQNVPRLRYDALVERLTELPDPDRPAIGGRLALLDPEVGSIDLVLAPYQSRLSHTEVRAVVLLAAKGFSPTPEERFRDAMGLGDDEARIALELIAGRPREDGPAREAKQAIVGALYRKLGTTRQADLVRLLLRPPGVLYSSGAFPTL